MATVSLSQNFLAKNIITNATQVTASEAPVVLTNISNRAIYIEGTSQNQTVLLPAANTLLFGQSYQIYNRTSSGVVTVQDATPATVTTITAGNNNIFTVANIGSTAGVWLYNSTAAADPSITNITSGTMYPTMVAGTGTQALNIAQAQFIINAASGATQLGGSAISLGQIGAAAEAVGTNSIAIGQSSRAETTGAIAIGSSAKTGSGTANLIVGSSGLTTSSGGYNTIVGNLSFTSPTTGEYNTIMGYTSGTATTTGSSNVVIGAESSILNTSIGSVAIGRAAASGTDYGIALGFGAKVGITAIECIAIGKNSGNPTQASNTGDYNIGIGANTLLSNTTGSFNIVIGTNALDANTIGSSNIAIGTSALTANISGEGNTVIGSGSVISNTTGSYNTVVGRTALQLANSDHNTVLGYAAAYNATTSGYLTAIGSSAAAASTGINTAVGYEALGLNSTGARNVSLGHQAGKNSTGSDNIHVGHIVDTTTTTSNAIVMGSKISSIPSLGTLTTQSTSGFDYYFSSVAYSPFLNRFVAVANTFPAATNQVMYSTDGITWSISSISGPTAQYWNCVIWESKVNRFVAFASGPITLNRCMYSSDGISWTVTSTTIDSSWTAVAWSASLPRAIVVSANSASTIITSTTGNTTWSSASISPVIGYFNDITYSPDLDIFCAVGGGGSIAVTAPGTVTWRQVCYPSPPLIATAASCSSTTATITVASTSQLTSNQYVFLQGFSVPQYNGVYQITVASGTTFTYTVPVASLTTLSGGDLGVIFPSIPPGTQSVQKTTHNWVSVAWSSQLKLFAAVSATGTDLTRRIVTSPDGITWTLQDTPTGFGEFKSITWGDSAGYFVVVGKSSSTTTNAIISRNGIDWVGTTIAANNVMTDITYNNTSNLFVTVSNTGTANRVMTSTIQTNVDTLATASANFSSAIGPASQTSGANSLTYSTGSGSQLSNNWQTVGIPSGDSNNEYLDIVWAASISKFVAIAYSGVANNLAATSTDGQTWTLRTTPSGQTSFRGIAWSPDLSLFVVVTDLGTSLARSTDGETWVNTGFSGTGTSGSFYGIIWCPELKLFVIVGSNTVSTSADGLVWTARTVPSKLWYGIEWSNDVGLLVACAISGTSEQIITSPDGITWTARTTPVVTATNRLWADLAYSPTLHLFAAVSYTNASSQIMTSPDGITWTLQKTPSQTAEYYTIIWVPQIEMFVAPGFSSGIAKILTSSDGINWSYKVFPSNNLNGYGIEYSPQLNILVTTLLSGSGFGTTELFPITNQTPSDNTISVGKGIVTTATNTVAIGTNIIAANNNGLYLNHRTAAPYPVNPVAFVPNTKELVEVIPYYGKWGDGSVFDYNTAGTIQAWGTVWSDQYGMQTSGGTFVLPVSGTWQIICNKFMNSGGYQGISLSVNTVETVYSYTSFVGYQMFTINEIEYYAAGTTIQIRSISANTFINAGTAAANNLIIKLLI